MDKYFSNGSSNSKGVAILFPNNIIFELCDKKYDNEGRMLIVKLKIQSNLILPMKIF